MCNEVDLDILIISQASSISYLLVPTIRIATPHVCSSICQLTEIAHDKRPIAIDDLIVVCGLIAVDSLFGAGSPVVSDSLILVAGFNDFLVTWRERRRQR